MKEYNDDVTANAIAHEWLFWNIQRNFDNAI